MLQHTVVFRLKHPQGSTPEREFLAAAKTLSKITGVEQFQCLRQVSDKNSFHFGLSMFFANEEVYLAYNADPRHVAFVEDRWKPEVEEFLELDYVELE